MKKFTWRGIDCLIVAELERNRCTGCLFREPDDHECPHTDEETAINCDSKNSVVFIENTEEALTAYIAKKLEGT